MSALAMILTAAIVVSDEGQPRESGEVLQEPKPTLLIRQYPKDGNPRKRGDAIRVRLDTDRLRAQNLSGEDVLKTFVESSVVGPGRRVDPPGVVFVKRLGRPEQYEKLIVIATSKGEIVRLKDVAKVEVDR